MPDNKLICEESGLVRRGLSSAVLNPGQKLAPQICPTSTDTVEFSSVIIGMERTETAETPIRNQNKKNKKRNWFTHLKTISNFPTPVQFGRRRKTPRRNAQVRH